MNGSIGRRKSAPGGTRAAGGSGAAGGSAGAWLAPLRSVLDRCPEGSVRWFVRDDDAGWADDRLWALVDVFATAGVPLEVAAVPAAIGRVTGTRLGRLVAERAVRVHQHGWSHRNHEPVGRRCEFGPTRHPRAQLQDLRNGRDRLAQWLGGRVEPVFVPPWNRCTPETVSLLPMSGFLGLSRDAAAAVTHRGGVGEVGVAVDWSAHWRAGGPAAVGRALAAAATRCTVDAGASLGVMLHHADHGWTQNLAVRRFLGLLGTHPACAHVPLTLLVAAASTAGAPDLAACR